jgi:hypothetical protein
MVEEVAVNTPVARTPLPRDLICRALPSASRRRRTGMKRCPLCDFIYEDDQSHCDMDGIELVPERGALIPAGKETTHKSLAPARPPRRRRTLHLLLAFGLGASIFSAYYTSVDEAATASGPAPDSYAGRPAPAPVEAPPGPGAPTPAAPAAAAAESPGAAGVVAPPAAPAREPRAVRAGEKRPRSEGRNKKKESRLDSFLSKTGRILKKPFKF